MEQSAKKDGQIKIFEDELVIFFFLAFIISYPFLGNCFYNQHIYRSFTALHFIFYISSDQSA